MLKKDDIIIIDDVFGPQVQDTLHAWLTEGDCPWFFSRDIAFSDDVIERNNYRQRYGFSKTFFSVVTKVQNPMFNTIFPLVLQACDQINFVVEQTLFSRSFLTTPVPNSDPTDYDHVHVDLVEPHLVCLYYVNDSDGDTVFFDKCVDDYLVRPDVKHAIENIDYSVAGAGPLEIIDNLVDKSEFKIINRVTPKKGRMVFFNGYRYHSACRPTDGYRIVINSNLKGHFRNE